MDIPVQIVWGEEDAWLSVEQAGRLSKAIPGSRLEVIAGAGHFVMEDAPEEVSALLAGFLQ